MNNTTNEQHSVLFSENELNELVGGTSKQTLATSTTNNTVLLPSHPYGTNNSQLLAATTTSNSNISKKIIDFDAVLNSEDTVKLTSTPDRLKSIEVKKNSGIKLEAKEAATSSFSINRSRNKLNDDDDDDDDGDDYHSLIGAKEKVKKKQEIYWDFLKNSTPENDAPSPANNTKPFPNPSVANTSASASSGRPLSFDSPSGVPLGTSALSHTETIQVDDDDEDAELFGIKKKKKEMSMAEFLASTGPTGYKEDATKPKHHSGIKPKDVPLEASSRTGSIKHSTIVPPANRPNGMKSTPSLVQKLRQITPSENASKTDENTPSSNPALDMDQDDEDAELFGVRRKKKEMTMAEFLRETAPSGFKETAEPTRKTTVNSTTGTNSLSNLIAAGPRAPTSKAAAHDDESDEDDELFGIKKKRKEVSLADFLRDTGPPEPPAASVQTPDPPKKRGGIGAFFSKRKESNTHSQSTPNLAAPSQSANVTNVNNNGGKKYTMISIPQSHNEDPSPSHSQNNISASAQLSRNASQASRTTNELVKESEKMSRSGSDRNAAVLLNSESRRESHHSSYYTHPTNEVVPPVPPIPITTQSQQLSQSINGGIGNSQSSIIYPRKQPAATRVIPQYEKLDETASIEKVLCELSKIDPKFSNVLSPNSTSTTNVEFIPPTFQTPPAPRKRKITIPAVEVEKPRKHPVLRHILCQTDQTSFTQTPKDNNNNNNNNTATTHSTNMKIEEIETTVTSVIDHHDKDGGGGETTVRKATTSVTEYDHPTSSSSSSSSRNNQGVVDEQAVVVKGLTEESTQNSNLLRKDMVDTQQQTDPIQLVNERHIALDRVCQELAEESLTLSEQVKLLRNLLQKERDERVLMESEAHITKHRFENLVRISYDSIVNVVESNRYDV